MTAPTRLVSVAQVVEWSGLSRSVVYELVATGELPAVRVGRAVRIRVEDWEAFVASHMTAVAS